MSLFPFTSNLSVIDLWNLLPYRQKAQRKNYLREVLSQKRRILTQEKIQEASSAIIHRLKHNAYFQNAQNVLIYYPIHHEVDLRPLMEEMKGEKHFYLPVSFDRSMEFRLYTSEEDLHHGKFGIPEPTGKAFKGKPDLIIVPGVAFDKHHNRLGRGGGYYDRYLKKYRRVPKIGVAYDFQFVDEVPTNRHDVQMTHIICPSQG